MYNLYNSFALIFDLIASATSWIWAYLYNMFTALPALIFSLVFIQQAKKPKNPIRKFITQSCVVLALALAGVLCQTRKPRRLQM
ncbi:hypothetical protein [Winogradskyella sp.]|uniref:hypothetical protein n=1 Tax=Winogradskyella sp. TaxID=1883156 RepID=UPI0026060B49|nr:hypothetical protein [Winogradskyella sp.]